MTPSSKPGERLSAGLRAPLALAMATGLASWQAQAQVQIQDFATLQNPALAERNFEGDLELGFISRTGNESSSSFNGRTDLTWYRERWSYNLHLYAGSARSNDESTAERYIGAGRTRYNLADNRYLFGQLRLSVDRFSGYDNQLSLASGYGRQLVDTSRNALSAEVGPGVRRDRLDHGGVEYHALAYGGLDYGYRLSDTARFTQGLATEAVGDHLTLRSETSLRLALNAAFSVRLTYLADHESNPPAGAAYRTDTTTILSIVYGL